MNKMLISVLLEQAIDTYAIQLGELSASTKNLPPEERLSQAAIERIHEGLGKTISRGGIRQDSTLGLAIAEYEKEAGKAADLTREGLSRLKSSLLKKAQEVILAQGTLTAKRAGIAHRLLGMDEGELADIPIDYVPKSLLEAGVSPQAREEKNWNDLLKAIQECDELDASLTKIAQEEIELRTRFWTAITHFREKATDLPPPT
ncbi:hypothetical protein [Comamonas badia]|uniref:hypothetical protein n=1 Tax=Comamonas badia TaxID=265291 RepID=UPI000465AABD|nr:hypothetical protein [Comamonas badia]